MLRNGLSSPRHLKTLTVSPGRLTKPAKQPEIPTKWRGIALA
jgi:hypothetical protein